MTNPDWRLRGQEKYLTGARLRDAEYRAPSESWDHDHCEFCMQKISAGAVTDGAARMGWQTEDEYRWLCDACFADFRESLGFVVVADGAPRRGVELHDATVLEVTELDGLVVVRLDAFVHDDFESDTCVGCWQPIDLTFYDATFERRGSGEPCLHDGAIVIDDQVTSNMLPLPFHKEGAVVATFTGADFELSVRAHRVWVRVAGAPGEREDGRPG